jgi:hypothetical protein
MDGAAGRNQLSDCFKVDYPDRDLDRLTTFFRLFAAIPILIVLGSVNGGTWQWSYERGTAAAAGAGGLLFFGPFLMILFRQKYPRVVVRLEPRVGAVL